MMKFVEIKAELEKKLQVLKNTKSHLEFEGQKIIDSMGELKTNIDHINDMIESLDSLTKAAE